MILIVSIVFRILALIWSVVLLRKIRDWRMGFLTAMLALMSLRQGLTLRTMMAQDEWSLALNRVSFDEIPGLAVSILAGLAVIFLEQMLRDQKRAHEELRAREGQALQAQKMEALGHLAGRTAHDFNNLLTVIIGNAELVRSQLPEGHEALEDLREVEKASELAAELSGQILSFSRKQVVNETVFDINEVVEELGPILSQLLGDNVEYVPVLAPGKALVKADRSQLGQVLINLAVNARDAMFARGTFTVMVESDTHDETPSVVLTVRDTGHGMTQEDRARAFEPFYTTKPIGKGTGLGLSTCLGTVERNGGRITIQSSTPAGTEFRLVFPHATETEPSAPLPFEPAPDSTGSERVLIAEDEDQLRRIKVNALRNRGYEVIETTNGVEALQAVEDLEHPVALLVTDIVMPRMGGHELARRMREKDPNLPVLFTSGFVQSPDSEEVTGSGVTGFLQKPFGGQQFAANVRAILDRSLALSRKAGTRESARP